LCVYDRDNNEYRQQIPINTEVKKKYYTTTGSDGSSHNEFEMEINELTENFLKRYNKLIISNEKEAENIIKQFAKTKD
jgi:hypothetical protein